MSEQNPALAEWQDEEPIPDPQRFVRLRRLHERAHANPVSAFITKVVITIIGLLLIAVGIIMLFTPGQGILAVIAGLAVLSLEYVWAQRLLRKAQDRLQEARDRARAMDPTVRRRRLIATTLATVLIGGALVAYLVVYDWPSFAVSGWDWVQGLSSFVPDLPGM
jgi:uncharacterized protein (TIGR02611 family)